MSVWTPMLFMILRGMAEMVYDCQSKWPHPIEMICSIGESMGFICEIGRCILFDILCELIPFGYFVPRTEPIPESLYFYQMHQCTKEPNNVTNELVEDLRADDIVSHDCTNLCSLLEAIDPA